MTTPLLIDQNTPVFPCDENSALTVSGLVNRPIRVENVVVNGAKKEWGMKVTDVAFDLTCEQVTFMNGRERALDWVRGGVGQFTDCQWLVPTTRPIITSKWDLSKYCDVGLKGGVRDVTFTRCSLNDILLGDYSVYDQIERPKARRITLDHCTNPHGGPIIVRGRFFEGDTLVVKNTPVDVLVWWPWVTSAYFCWNKCFGDHRQGLTEEFTILPEERV